MLEPVEAVLHSIGLLRGRGAARALVPAEGPEEASSHEYEDHSREQQPGNPPSRRLRAFGGKPQPDRRRPRRRADRMQVHQAPETGHDQRPGAGSRTPPQHDQQDERQNGLEDVAGQAVCPEAPELAGAEAERRARADQGQQQSPEAIAEELPAEPVEAEQLEQDGGTEEPEKGGAVVSREAGEPSQQRNVHGGIEAVVGRIGQQHVVREALRMIVCGRERRDLGRIRAEPDERVLAVAAQHEQAGGQGAEEHERRRVEGIQAGTRARLGGRAAGGRDGGRSLLRAQAPRQQGRGHDDPEHDVHEARRATAKRPGPLVAVRAAVRPGIGPVGRGEVDGVSPEAVPAAAQLPDLPSRSVGGAERPAVLEQPRRRREGVGRPHAGGTHEGEPALRLDAGNRVPDPKGVDPSRLVRRQAPRQQDRRGRHRRSQPSPQQALCGQPTASTRRRPRETADRSPWALSAMATRTPAGTSAAVTP